MAREAVTAPKVTQIISRRIAIHLWVELKQNAAFAAFSTSLLKPYLKKAPYRYPLNVVRPVSDI
jgi:hypothetical protein